MLLEESVVKDPSAIEKIFCAKMESLERYPMNNELSEIMIQLMVAKNIPDIPEDQKPFLFKVIEGRMEAHTFKFADKKPQIFLSALIETPGEAVMYLWYLQYWCFKHNIKELSFDQFCTDIFPWGFPNREGINEAWNIQKVKTQPDNLLDWGSAGLSIQFQ